MAPTSERASEEKRRGLPRKREAKRGLRRKKMEWEEEWARAGRASAQRLVPRFSLLCPVPEECAQSGVGGRDATRRDYLLARKARRENQINANFASSPSLFYHFQRTEKSGTVNINGKTCQSDIFSVPLILSRLRTSTWRQNLTKSRYTLEFFVL